MFIDSASSSTGPPQSHTPSPVCTYMYALHMHCTGTVMIACKCALNYTPGKMKANIQTIFTIFTIFKQYSRDSEMKGEHC